MTPGPQFQQPGLFAAPEPRDPSRHWDAARAAHHLGNAEMPYDPYHASPQMGQVYTPDVASQLSARGVSHGMTPRVIHRAHGHVGENEWRGGSDDAVDVMHHYDPREGQTIMSIHNGALQVPMRIQTSELDNDGQHIGFEGSHPLELDHHGNVEDSRHPRYGMYAPQHSAHAYEVFQEHGRDVTIHPHTPLHTGQPAWSTGQLDDIQGPVREDSPPIPIVMKAGTPYLMDGHHRRAKAAALGQSIRGRVVNAEQFGYAEPA